MPGEGQPTSCTPQLIERAEKLLAGGHPVRAMCRALRISHTAHYGWMKRGEAGEQPWADYVAAVHAGMAEAEAIALKAVRAAIPDDFRAATWWLEHVMPEDYGRQRIEVTGSEGGPVQVDLRAKIAEVLAERSDAQAGVPDDL